MLPNHFGLTLASWQLLHDLTLALGFMFNQGCFPLIESGLHYAWHMEPATSHPVKDIF
jgi:hypothetical protein